MAAGLLIFVILHSAGFVVCVVNDFSVLGFCSFVCFVLLLCFGVLGFSDLFPD